LRSLPPARTSSEIQAPGLPTIRLIEVFTIALRTTSIFLRRKRHSERSREAQTGTDPRITVEKPVAVSDASRGEHGGQSNRDPLAEGLRTLDALQLAIALDLRQFGLIGVVAADQRLIKGSAALRR
jgi:hypothetical protein